MEGQRRGRAPAVGRMVSSSVSPAVDINRALIGDLVSRQPLLALINATIGTAFALTYLPARPPGLIAGWIAAMLVAQAARLVLWRDCQRRLALGLLAGLSAKLTVGSLMSGCLWGFAGWAMFVPDPPYNAVIPFTLAGMVAGAVLTLPAHPAAFYTFYVPALLPYALRLMLEPSAARQLMAAITLIFCVAIGLIGYQQRRGLVRVARLSRQNADLVAQLREAGGELEQRVVERTAELRVVNARLAAEVLERERSEERIRHLLDHDPLTGLPNRRLLMDRIEQALARARREGGGVAVMMIDLDDFKSVNDRFGHPAGDELLRLVARRLREALRDTDTVARMGGDEFAVVAAGLNATGDALVLARKLHARATAPARLEAGETVVGIGIGVALFPADGATAVDLLKRADLALYAVKRRQRGGVAFYDENLDRAASDRRRLEGELAAGLEARQFVLVYQPRLRLDDGALVGVEALLRWNHPERGQLPAEAFVGAAEASGLIRPLGAWAIEQACHDLAGLGIEAGELGLAVNLSGAELRDTALPGLLERILETTMLPGRRLELEIGESACAQHGAETVQSLLQGIRPLGVLVALDHFGTGMLPLTQMARLAVDRIKIDRRVVANVDTDAGDRGVVAAAVALARAAGNPAVAMGVERAGPARGPARARLRRGPGIPARAAGRARGADLAGRRCPSIEAICRIF